MYVLGAHPGAAAVAILAKSNAVVVAHYRRPLILVDREALLGSGKVLASQEGTKLFAEVLCRD
jgi:hypothetical protein